MPSKMDPEKHGTNVLVTVDEGCRGELKVIARRLEAAGMNVAETFPLGGVIAGEVASANLDQIRAVKGVASVEKEPRFDALGETSVG